MGDVSKCLDAIVEFFNNSAPQLNSQGNNNEIYESVLRQTVNKILDLDNEDRIKVFNCDVNNALQQMTYKNDYIYHVLSRWKGYVLSQTIKVRNSGPYYDYMYVSLDPESHFYRQGDRVFYEYVKRDKDDNIIDKLIAEIKFHYNISDNKKKIMLTANEASLLLNNNVYNLTDEESDTLINEIMKHKNYDLSKSNVYNNISNDMDRRLTSNKFVEYNSSKSGDSYIVNNAMLENLIKNDLGDNKDVLNHNEFALTFHCYTNFYNVSDVIKSQYSLKIDERWLVTTNIEFGKQKELILQYVLTSRDAMRRVTLTAHSSKDVFAVKDDNGVWSARDSKTRKFECDKIAKNIPLSSDIVYEFEYEELYY